MNKTVIIVASIITSAFLLVSYWYIQYLNNRGFVKLDKFTTCIQTVMSESRQGGQIIDAEKAKDICVHAKDNKLDK